MFYGATVSDRLPQFGFRGCQHPVACARYVRSSFVSAPSTEDPLHQVEPEFSPVPFSPDPNFGFFDRFLEDAKAATEKNKKQILGELLENEADPSAFLRIGQFLVNQFAGEVLILCT